MQRPINQEIRHYEESVFMGLTLWQTLWAGAAVAAAVFVYFGARDVLGQETVSWVCIVAAAPFAAMGFFRYDGMNAWHFLKAVIRTEFIQSGLRLWASENKHQKRKTEKMKRREKRK